MRRKRIWLIASVAVTVVCVGLIGWRVQRRYFPTCGQFAEHVTEIFDAEDANRDRMTVGQTRAICIDNNTSMALRRAAMGAETVQQLADFTADAVLSAP